MIEFRTRRPQTGGDGSTATGYEQIYQTKPIQQIDSFYTWALGLAEIKPGQRVLDVSCGVGRLVNIASKYRVKALGVDFSETAVKSARTASCDGTFIVGDAEALPFPNRTFDRILNLGSVEHYENPDRGIAEMARVLRPSGRAIVLVPNTFSYQHVLYAWRNGRVFDDGQPLQRYGTLDEWKLMLERNGLSVLRTVKYQRVRPRSRTDLVWYLWNPAKLAQLLLTPILPLHAAACFTFICTV